MTIGRIAAFAALIGIGWAGANAPALTAAEPEARSLIQEADKEELKLVLPKPMFVGTPRNIRTPNLEVVTGKPRGPFFVPKGTVLPGSLYLHGTTLPLQLPLQNH